MVRVFGVGIVSALIFGITIAAHGLDPFWLAGWPVITVALWVFTRDWVDEHPN